VVTPVARREAVAHARAAFDLSERRACPILGFDRTSVRYRSSRGEDAIFVGDYVPWPESDAGSAGAGS
jgi:putative transposase